MSIEYIDLRSITIPREVNKTKEFKKVRVEILKLIPYCLKCESKKELHIDHIYPVSIYPKRAFNYKNLQVLCKECNIEKSNTTVIDYRNKRDIDKLKKLFIDNDYFKYQSIYYKRYKRIKRNANRKRLGLKVITNPNTFNKSGKKVIIRRKGLQDQVKTL